jgi:hypothetical protein
MVPGTYGGVESLVYHKQRQLIEQGLAVLFSLKLMRVGAYSSCTCVKLTAASRAAEAGHVLTPSCSLAPPSSPRPIV